MIRPAALPVLACLLALAGCGGDESREGTTAEPGGGAPAADAGGRPPTAPDLTALDRPSCPPSSSNCDEAAGAIVFVERVDPDGDGDAHFVLAGSDGVTAPGISVIDVAPALRPSPLPGPGDLLAAAGPVYEGSRGQRQIQATEIAFERVRGPEG